MGKELRKWCIGRVEWHEGGMEVKWHGSSANQILNGVNVIRIPLNFENEFSGIFTCNTDTSR